MQCAVDQGFVGWPEQVIIIVRKRLIYKGTGGAGTISVWSLSEGPLRYCDDVARLKAAEWD